jgi:hypothetical protein
MADLLVESCRSLGSAVVPLEAATLQVHPRDRDGRMPVGQDIGLGLQVGLCLGLQDLP